MDSLRLFGEFLGVLSKTPPVTELKSVLQDNTGIKHPTETEALAASAQFVGLGDVERIGPPSTNQTTSLLNTSYRDRRPPEIQTTTTPQFPDNGPSTSINRPTK